MKNTVIIFFILVLYSCGIREGGDPEVRSNLGEYTGVQARLSSAQKNSAVRVCQSFRTKRFNFSSMGGNQFDFSFHRFNCDELDASNYEFNAKLIYQSNFLPMYFNYDGDLGHFTNIETDTHGVLVEFCKEVLAGNDIFNELSIKGNSKVIFDFVKGKEKGSFVLNDESLNLGFDKVSISFASRDKDKKLLIDKVVMLEIITEENNKASSFMGLVTRKEEKESCVSKKNAIQIESVKIQTFIRN